MSTRSAHHERSRISVCGVCFRKPKDHQKISPMILELIKKHCYTDYSLDDLSLPLIVCKSCAKTLKVVDSDKPNRKVPGYDYTLSW